MNLVLIRLWGVYGLALATSLSAIITFFVRLAAARKYVKLGIRAMAETGFKVFTASAVACLIPRVVFWVYPANKYLMLIVSAAVGAGVYLVLIKLLKVNEIDDLVALLKRKLKKG